MSLYGAMMIRRCRARCQQHRFEHRFLEYRKRQHGRLQGRPERFLHAARLGFRQRRHFLGRRDRPFRRRTSRSKACSPRPRRRRIWRSPATASSSSARTPTAMPRSQLLYPRRQFHAGCQRQSAERVRAIICSAGRSMPTATSPTDRNDLTAINVNNLSGKAEATTTMTLQANLQASTAARRPTRRAT